MSLTTLEIICYVWLSMAIAIHIVMFFIKAPFGRHTSTKWGPMINNKLGWMIMEAPSLLIMGYFLFFGSYSLDSYAWILFALWMIHYTNRTFVYPLRIRPTEKKMPLFIMFNGILFNCMNAGLNGYFLAELASADQYNEAWLSSNNFGFGLAVFGIGMAINWVSDTKLIRLRKPGETGYKIPRGFLFEYISSPNLFGELMEWGGFAIWSL